MVKKLEGHIIDEEYLTCKKIWKDFNSSLFEKRYFVID